MRFIRIVLFLFLFTDACIERYDLPGGISSSSLVVDGMITDQSGPYTIRLSMSANVGEGTVTQMPVRGATVRIIDDLNNESLLTESTEGTYTTSDNFRGMVGRKYYASIRIGDREYVSTAQELTPGGTIDRIYHKFQYNVVNPGEVTANHAFDIFVDSKGTEGYPNLFRWRWSSVYEIRTYPELRVTYIDYQAVPDPLPCSGFIFAGGMLTMVDTCYCCNCWVSESGSHANVSNNQFVNDDVFKNVFIARLALEKMRFEKKYYIKVDQLSLSEEVYEFWRLVKAQRDGQGSIFQPNSIRIRGNIRSLTDPDEEVFGVFAVSGVSSKDMFIENKEVPVTVFSDTLKGSCLHAFRRTTNIRPPFW